jgi:hypothetical protein
LCGTRAFQMFFHSFLSPLGALLLVVAFSLFCIVARRYTLLTANMPLFSNCQAIVSSIS